MGRVIIKLKDKNNYHFESYKCKSAKRASEVASKYRNLIEWNFYEDNERIPPLPKKKIESKEMTMEEMEQIISRL